MGLLQDAGSDDEPVRDADGKTRSLWMGACSGCGELMTILGHVDPVAPRCAACAVSDDA